jgi:polyisoprenoid-binding protein YceI
VTRRSRESDRSVYFGLAALLVLAGAPSPGFAQREIPDGAVLKGTLSFDGRATVGDFTGATDSVSGRLTGGGSLVEVRGWVEAPVKTLSSGNGRRDRDLNKSMQSETYPTIRFELTGVGSEWERGDSAGVVLRGDLTVHGVTQGREIPATVQFEGALIRVQCTFPLNLKDHKIGGLSKFLGVLKMHPDIVVHADLTFGPPAPMAPPAPSPGETRSPAVERTPGSAGA